LTKKRKTAKYLPQSACLDLQLPQKARFPSPNIFSDTWQIRIFNRQKAKIHEKPIFFRKKRNEVPIWGAV
jgi:hypothetical protein